jgi:hypothetical protein
LAVFFLFCRDHLQKAVYHPTKNRSTNTVFAATIGKLFCVGIHFWIGQNLTIIFARDRESYCQRTDTIMSKPMWVANKRSLQTKTEKEV